MKLCPGCGAAMEDSAAFCTQCGTKFQNNSTENTSSSQNQGAATGGETNNTTNTGTSGTASAGMGSGVYTNASYTNQTYNGTPNYQGGPVYAPVDPYDHTAEFSPKDISENKVIAMLVYLLGTVGIIIALLGAQTSPYAAFHVRQALKFTVINVLMGIITLFLCWTIIVPLAALLAIFVLFIVKIICFFSICKGQAKEPPIIRSFGFLR